jgi:hypothetical protein
MKRIFGYAYVFLATFCAVVSAADVVTTIAGDGTGSSTGDGGQALAATVNDPVLMARDANGNLYFTEYSGNRIRKIDTNGIITTVAGTGVAGYSGDGGPATAAQIRTPIGIVVDSAGNLYFSEQQNHIIRKVDTSGIISTAAGNGTAGQAGDGLPASQSILNTPASMALDPVTGNIVWSELNSYRIRFLDTNGFVNTLAGTGSPGMLNDGGTATTAQIGVSGGMSFTPNGDMFFVDGSNVRIRKISGGILTSIAGTGAAGFSGDGGPAASATFSFQSGSSYNGAATVDSQGNIFITDFYNNRIRRIDAATMNIDTVLGTGSATFNGDGLAPLATATNALHVLLNADGSLIFTDGNRIRRTVINPPAPTSASISAVFTSGGVDFETRSVKSGTTVKWTGSGVDPNNIGLQFTWDFGDGSATVTGKSVSHLMSVSTGESTFTVTVTAGHANGSVTATATISVAAPASGGTINIAQGDSAILNPLLDIKTKLFDSDGGVLQLDISGTAVGRAPFDLNTDFDGLKGRVATRLGFRPLQRFSEPGMFVATHKATDKGTGLDAGKARRTLAVSDRELGTASSSVTPPASHELKLKSMTGKFLFGRSGAATAAKPDTVTYSGTIELPAGLTLTGTLPVAIGIGNIIDSAVVSAKGKATLPSTLGRIKKLQVKFPKLAKGTTATTAGQLATVTIGFSSLNMSANGFDTEGVTGSVRSDEVGEKSVTRNIQVALVIGGVAYDSLAPVQFKLSKKKDAGAISGRGAR